MWYNEDENRKREGAFHMPSVEKYRVIVAHGDPGEQQRISRLLEATRLFKVIFTTHSGEVCIRQTLLHQPELVVADTLLAGVDGLEVMEQVHRHCVNTKVLLLTSFNTLACRRAVLEQADYCIMSPYAPEMLGARAVALMRTQRDDLFPIHLVSSRAAAHLAILSAPMKLKGYPYVSDGAQIAVLDPDAIRYHAGPNGLYTQLCRRHNETYIRLERCMRSVGEFILKHSTLDVLQEYFTPVDISRGRVTNLTLISTLAAHITNDLREQQKRDVL